MYDYDFMDTPWNYYTYPEVTEIILSKYITSIGSWAFSDCVKVETIDLPYGIERIGDSAFSFSTSYLETDAGIKIIAKQSNLPTAVGTCTVYGAIYDANGKMLAVAAEFCGSANDGTYACQLLLPVAVPAGGTVMVFLLDSELAPLTESTYLFP